MPLLSQVKNIACLGKKNEEEASVEDVNDGTEDAETSRPSTKETSTQSAQARR